jgi:uncharacterized protein YjbI with pentapeptide repeats
MNTARLDLQTADLRKADPGDAHLEGAILIGAHLEGTNLGDAHLEGATATDTTRWPDGFAWQAAGIILVDK